MSHIPLVRVGTSNSEVRCTWDFLQILVEPGMELADISEQQSQLHYYRIGISRLAGQI
jgi:hypothetical protein